MRTELLRSKRFGHSKLQSAPGVAQGVSTPTLSYLDERGASACGSLHV